MEDAKQTAIPIRKTRQLGPSMQHMRYAVTAEPIYHHGTPQSSSSDPPTPVETDDYGVPLSISPPRKPATRSGDAVTNPQTRTDPFAFGSRYLEEGDDVFAHNAWDNVDVDAAYRDFADSQYARQRAAPVTDFDRTRFNAHPQRFWDAFYAHNAAHFFKDRAWLHQEFPVLARASERGAPACVLLEVGAGAGNSAFPILARNESDGLRVHACDFSKRAVELMRKHEAYDERHMRADVWDAAAAPPQTAPMNDEADRLEGGEEVGDPSLPPGLGPESVDIVLMVFIFSALAPAQWAQAVRNAYRLLKPGGLVLFRDYGRGDLAQVRFKQGRWMDENFYVRGDGTRVYFFGQDELRDVWTVAMEEQPQQKEDEQEEEAKQGEEQKHASARFELVNIGTDRRLLVNRQRKLKMYRCWIQACFRKPGPSSWLDDAPALKTETAPPDPSPAIVNDKDA